MQCKLSLQEKLDTVKQLVSEILELVDDAEVDNEIEQVDNFKEQVQVTIIDATAAVEARKMMRAPSPSSPPIGAPVSSVAVSSTTSSDMSGTTVTLTTASTTAIFTTHSEAYRVPLSSVTAPIIMSREFHAALGVLATTISKISSDSTPVLWQVEPLTHLQLNYHCQLCQPPLLLETLCSIPLALQHLHHPFGDSPHCSSTLIDHAVTDTPWSMLPR